MQGNQTKQNEIRWKPHELHFVMLIFHLMSTFNMRQILTRTCNEKKKTLCGSVANLKPDKTWVNRLRRDSHSGKSHITYTNRHINLFLFSDPNELYFYLRSVTNIVNKLTGEADVSRVLKSESSWCLSRLFLPTPVKIRNNNQALDLKEEEINDLQNKHWNSSYKPVWPRQNKNGSVCK